MPNRPYFFGLEQFKVEDRRSKGDHNDSDWLTVTTQINGGSYVRKNRY